MAGGCCRLTEDSLEEPDKNLIVSSLTRLIVAAFSEEWERPQSVKRLLGTLRSLDVGEVQSVLTEGHARGSVRG